MNTCNFEKKLKNQHCIVSALICNVMIGLVYVYTLFSLEDLLQILSRIMPDPLCGLIKDTLWGGFFSVPHTPLVPEMKMKDSIIYILSLFALKMLTGISYPI